LARRVLNHILIDARAQGRAARLQAGRIKGDRDLRGKQVAATVSDAHHCAFIEKVKGRRLSGRCNHYGHRSG
jgi:hypothetical protein